MYINLILKEARKKRGGIACISLSHVLRAWHKRYSPADLYTLYIRYELSIA